MMLDSKTAIGRIFDMLMLAFIVALSFSNGAEGEWATAGWGVGLAIAYVLQNMVPGVRVVVNVGDGSHGKDARVVDSDNGGE